MALEDVGVRLVIENLSGFVSGMKSINTETQKQVDSLGNLSSAYDKARAQIDRIIDGEAEHYRSLADMVNMQEMASRGMAGMQGPVRSTTDAFEQSQKAVSDDSQELLSMTGALNSTKTGWEKFKSSMDSTMESVRQHKILIGGFGAAIVGSLGLMVKGAEAQRLSQNKLSVALGNVGVSYAEVRKELEATMAATARKTGISDEAQREALSQLVFITGSYKASLEALPVVLDLAAAKGMDASSAARILGRAMAGSTDMLKRYGIYVQEGASATEILAAVQRQAAGAAEAMASPFTIAKDQIGEMGESIGTVLLPPLKLFTTVVVEAVNVIKWFVDNTGFLGKGMVYLAGVVGVGTLALVAYATALKSGVVQETIAIARKVAHAGAQWIMNAAYAAGIAPATGFAAAVNLAIWPLTLIVGIIAAVVAGIVLLIKNWNKVMNVFGLGKKTVKDTADSVDNLSAKLADLREEETRLTEEQTDAEEQLKILQDEYAYVERNAAGYREEIKRLNAGIDAHKAKISGLNTQIDATRAKMDALETSAANAYDELNRLASPRIEGMQEYEDQIFDVEQQIKGLRLVELETGATDETAAEIERLERELSLLQLKSEITFDPLIRDAKEAVEDITGANDAWNMALFTNESGRGRTYTDFIQGQANILTANAAAQRALTTELNGYTTELTAEITAMNGLQTILDSIMTIVNAQLETMSENILTLTNRIYELTVAKQELAAATATQEATDKLHTIPTDRKLTTEEMRWLRENKQMMGENGQYRFSAGWIANNQGQVPLTAELFRLLSDMPGFLESVTEPQITTPEPVAPTPAVITPALQGIIDTLGDGINSLAEAIAALARTYPDKGEDWYNAIAKAMGFQKGTDFVSGTAPALVHKGEAIIPTDINKAFGEKALSFLRSLMTTGEAQFGGYFPQMQPVRVGERGPEVVMMPAGSTVQPNQYNTTNYNVNAHYANPQTPQGIGMDLEAIRIYSRV